MNSRIKLEMTIQEVIFVMSEGNPGAVSVLAKLFKLGSLIDPDNLLGPLGAIMFLDTLQIYASRIWILYKDVCNCDVSHFVALLRSVQLGVITTESLLAGIATFGTGLNVEEIVRQVKDKLPRFNLLSEAE